MKTASAYSDPRVFEAAFSSATEFDVRNVLAAAAYLGIEARQVLDCACGSGRVCYSLAEKGLKCIGYDLNNYMLDAAEALHKHRNAWFTLGDMSDFYCSARFDLIISLNNSICYLLSWKRAQQFIENSIGMLKVDGVFIVELSFPHIELPSAEPASWSFSHCGLSGTANWEIVSEDVDANLSEQIFTAVFDEDGTRKSIRERHILRLWTARHWFELISQSGARVVAVFDKKMNSVSDWSQRHGEDGNLYFALRPVLDE